MKMNDKTEPAPTVEPTRDVTLRELDKQIGIRVMGLWVYHYDKGYTPYWMLVTPDLTPVNFMYHENERTSEALAWEEDMPYYSTDLNACFEAQAKCIEMVGIEYGDALAEIVGVHNCADKYDAFTVLATATAEQRCRAMLKAIEGAK